MTDFVNYCKKKYYRIIIPYLIFFAIYGMWLSKDFVSFDAEQLYSSAGAIEWYKSWIALGRWALVVLKKILGVWIINPDFSLAIFATCFPLSVIIWNYLFYKWNKNTDSIFNEFIFSCIYISHPIFVYQFAYRNQIEVITIVMVLLPIFISFFGNWLENNKRLDFIISFFGIIFCFASYQSFLVLYAEAIIVYFFYEIMNNELDKKIFLRKMLKTIIFSIITFFTYKLSCSLSLLIANQFVHCSDTQYLSSQIMWLSKDIKECFDSLAMNLKSIFIGDSYTYSSVYILELLVAVLLYVKFIHTNKHSFFKGWLAIIIILMFICPLSINIATAGQCVIRQEFALAFAIAWIASFELTFIEFKFDKMKKICLLTLVAFTVSQVQLSERLLYSDSKIMISDYEKMLDIYTEAKKMGANSNSAIVFIGSQDYYTNDNSVIRNEVIGISYFQVLPIAPTKLTKAMQAYGFDVEIPSSTQIKLAQQVSENLSIYPVQGSIYVEENLIVVRLS